MDVALLPREFFRINSFNVIMDALQSSLMQRGEAYLKIAEKFSFITRLDSSETTIEQGVKNLVSSYPDDIDASLKGELLYFKTFCQATDPHKSTYTHQEMYSYIYQNHTEKVFRTLKKFFEFFLP